MKKLTLLSIITLLLFAVSPYNLSAKTKDSITVSSNVPANVKVMLNRLEEIKEIDKSTLNSTEKKELRSEVKAIKSSLKSTGNGVYLSVGAIIVILLILILIL